MKKTIFLLLGLCLVFSLPQAHARQMSPQPLTLQSQPDYDGDGRAELSIRRIENDLISVISSEGRTQFNSSFATFDSDMPVIGDFDGDGLTDLAIRRLSSASWKVRNSSGSNFNSVLKNGEQWVVFGREKQDIPAIGDYDGDGISDFAVFRPKSQIWYVRNSSSTNYNSVLQDAIQRVKMGNKSSSVPVAGDYDGDGITDMALFDAQISRWTILYSSSPDSIQFFDFGSSGADIPVVADYDGDGKTDIAVWNGESLVWQIRESSAGQLRSLAFGYHSSDIPIVADYDGDGLADPALRSQIDRFVHILFSEDQSMTSFRVGHFDDVFANAPIYLVMQKVLSGNTRADTDGDGITDHEEVEAHGTNPYLPDSDGDSLSDFEEINHYFTNPMDFDSDDDGVSDGDEVATATDPNDPDSVYLPIATTQVTMNVNLPADAAMLDVNNFDPDDFTSFNASTSMTIFDSLGTPRLQTFYFLKDANAPTLNEWLIVTSIDDVFYDFANSDGTVPGVGFSNSPGSPPTMLADESRNVVAFGQSIIVDDGTGLNTTRNTGIWAVRMVFDAADDLSNLQAADRSFALPTTVPLTGNLSRGADSTQTISLQFNFEPKSQGVLEPTQRLLPFSVNLFEQNGRSVRDAIDTDHDGLSDFEEVNIHQTDPLDNDTDDDGWEDGVEVRQGTDPNSADNSIPPLSTSTVYMRMNLSADAQSLDANRFDPDDLLTYNASTSITIYDSLGDTHQQSFYFLKDVNAPTPHEWLMVTSIDNVFYDYINADTTVPGVGASNSPGNPPFALADPSSNIVGFGQAIAVDDGLGQTTSRNTGIWATRLVFDASGDLLEVQSADGARVPNNSVVGHILMPTTVPLIGNLAFGADATQTIGVNFSVDPLQQSAWEPTQIAAPFEIYSLYQDGLPGLSWRP